jgi:CPA2 family monovalent cation:H+ antiporter-2
MSVLSELGIFMFQLGIIMLLAFIGAALATRLKQSAIIGYMVVGVLIGPYISIEIGFLKYEGLIRDTVLIDALSHIGLILLLFFVGLQFSITKLKKTNKPSTILAITNLGINMFAGFMIGTCLGWPLIDTIFLAGVISMSSAALTVKSLIELKRLGNAETEFLLGMIIMESFMGMLLLTIIDGVAVSSALTSQDVTYTIFGIGLFMAFFLWLAVIAVPKVVHHFEEIKNDELFILFALGVVFLSAALADACRIPAFIGAFFIGMVFADTKLSLKLSSKLVTLRDAFVAVFFISFGMLIDLSVFPNVISILILAIPLIILNDVLITSALAFFIGMSSKGAMSLGTSLCGRGAESILYASIGSKTPSIDPDIGGQLLNPFTGVFCLIMSFLTPPLMKQSAKIAIFFSKILPKPIKFGGILTARTLRGMILPRPFPLAEKSKSLRIILILIFMYVIAEIITIGWVHLFLILLIPIILYVLWVFTHRHLKFIVKHINYSNLQIVSNSKKIIEIFITVMIVAPFAVAITIAGIWQYSFHSTLIVILGYFVFTVLIMNYTYKNVLPHPKFYENESYSMGKLLKYKQGSWSRKKIWKANTQWKK